MDALSLSHLTYCGATFTINFHRLDHPPFPCKGRLLPGRITGKSLQKHLPGTSGTYGLASHRRFRLLIASKGNDSMKPVTIIGFALVVIGVIGYATGGVSFTHEKKDVDLGSVQISHKTQDTFPLSPIFSTVSLVVGLGLVVVGARSK